jgi:hypothetical protein
VSNVTPRTACMPRSIARRRKATRPVMLRRDPPKRAAACAFSLAAQRDLNPVSPPESVTGRSSSPSRAPGPDRRRSSSSARQLSAFLSLLVRCGDLAQAAPYARLDSAAPPALRPARSAGAVTSRCRDAVLRRSRLGYSAVEWLDSPRETLDPDRSGIPPSRRLLACGSGGVLAVRGYPASPGYAPVAPFPDRARRGHQRRRPRLRERRDDRDHHARHGHREGSTPTSTSTLPPPWTPSAEC